METQREKEIRESESKSECETVRECEITLIDFLFEVFLASSCFLLCFLSSFLLLLSRFARSSCYVVLMVLVYY